MKIRILGRNLNIRLVLLFMSVIASAAIFLGPPGQAPHQLFAQEQEGVSEGEAIIIEQPAEEAQITIEAPESTQMVEVAAVAESPMTTEGAVTEPLAAEPTETIAQPEAAEEQGAPGTITLDFKDADIRSVLKIISLKTGVNIVASPDVSGTVTTYLEDVQWEKALDVILKTYGFGYEKKANVIMVAPLAKLTEQKKMEQELAEVQPKVSEVFELQYIDALDAKNALAPLLSSRGRITVLEMTGKAGWEFGDEALGKRKTIEGKRKSLAKMLLITDIPPVLDELREVLKRLDIKPRQIFIEAKVFEVTRDFLEDYGFEYSTQTVGGTDITTSASDDDSYKVGGQFLHVSPSVFNPSATLTPETAGMRLILKKILGSDFELIIHALEEDVNANLLSAPRIMTLDNQEAAILVGEKYPILKTTESESTTSVQVSLDYYQDIGIQLNVVPQIVGKDKINIIIHPAVTSRGTEKGTDAAKYPIINTREAQTQVIINDGETIVIGGLIKDNVKTSVIGVPILSKIPLLGVFFRRDTQDIEKVELLVFITARIVDESGLTQQEIELLEQQVAAQ